MANVLIGATGSVAAVRIPALYETLAAAGHAVKIVATEAAVYFFDPASLPSGAVIRDADEWLGERYQRDAPVVHVELRKWADAFVLAPLDANTLAKLAVGLCDNCLTCVWRAWDTAKPVILAPAMNAFMWQHPFTRRHLRAIAADCGAAHVPGHLDDAALFAQINERSKTLRIVAPVEKRLACGDTGMGGLAEVTDIAQAVADMLQRSAPAV
ncbi:MAG TPA: flavoprotein [Urbifossiella sp.]|nr:flavoprotein [Urbifossiella sp.]